MYHFTNNYFKYHQNTTPGYADTFHINILLTVLLNLMSPVTIFDAPRYIKLLFGFPVCVLVRPYVRPSAHRRTGQHLFGGADRVWPEWIQWGGGVVAEIFRDPYYVGWLNFFR